MHRLKSILLLGFLIGIATSAPAETYLIRPDGSGDFPTIQVAIDACSNGDIVELADGIYLGDGNRGLHFDGKAVTLRSQDGDPENCTLDCEGASSAFHRALRFDSGEQADSRVEGITMTGCFYNYGGAVSCTYGSSPSFANCRFVGNTARNQGGAVYCSDGSSPDFEDCLFLENSAASQGGAVFCDDSTSPSFFRCSFEQNRVDESAGTSGGSIYLSPHCEPPLTDCLFHGNEASYGGALACATDSRPMVKSSIFESNRAWSAGGAVVCNGALPRFQSCTFVDNHAETHGGGLRARLHAHVIFTDCLFSQNRADFNGGAVYSEDSILFVGWSTLAWNGASSGGGIFWTGDGPTLEKVIIAHSVSGQGVYCIDPGFAPRLSCCDLYGNAGGDWGACIADLYGVDGNFSADPLFCGSEQESIPMLGSRTSVLALRTDSPCLPGNHPGGENCGLIGAEGPGCAIGDPRGAPSLSEDDAVLVEVSTWGRIRVGFE